MRDSVEFGDGPSRASPSTSRCLWFLAEPERQRVPHGLLRGPSSPPRHGMCAACALGPKALPLHGQARAKVKRPFRCLVDIWRALRVAADRRRHRALPPTRSEDRVLRGTQEGPTTCCERSATPRPDWTGVNRLHLAAPRSRGLQGFTPSVHPYGSEFPHFRRYSHGVVLLQG